MSATVVRNLLCERWPCGFDRLPACQGSAEDRFRRMGARWCGVCCVCLPRSFSYSRVPIVAIGLSANPYFLFLLADAMAKQFSQESSTPQLASPSLPGRRSRGSPRRRSMICILWTRFAVGMSLLLTNGRRSWVLSVSPLPFLL
jgi:hypothetical protein